MPDVIGDIGNLVEAALKEALRERGHLNVLIAGRTGVGKSTLINAVFQSDLAQTGQGRPVTQNTREISKEGYPLTIWDTRGLELAAFRQSITELERFIRDRASDRDAHRHVHVAWLCIQEDGRRVEDAEIELHRSLARHVPVLGVITKARADSGFRVAVQGLLPETRNVVRVRALAEQFDDGHQLAPMGLRELVDATSEVIPEGHRRALSAAQRASIDYKKRMAHGVVASGAVAAGTAAAIPIPFADAFVLVPIQVGMLAGITATFGVELSKAFLATLVGAATGTTGATFIGRSIVGNLLKLVPGAGSLTGGVISAATASTITTALGEAYVATLAALFSSGEGRFPDTEAITREFKRRLLK